MIDINCDMGEGMDNDEALMPYINSANISCGYHAGDDATIKKTIELCLKYNVNIGAHPSFYDRANFGRMEMQLSSAEIYQLVFDQLSSFKKMVIECGAVIHHVKPHGALYNMAAKSIDIAIPVVQAVKDIDGSLKFYGLSGSVMITQAKALGLKTANEVFADRTYQADGSLTPRSLGNAMHKNSKDVEKHVWQMVTENKVITISGKIIKIKTDTICVHGDGPNAAAFAKTIYRLLNEE